MNERIKELAEQVGLKFSKDWGECYTGNVQIEHFAKLVDAAAVAREREACAKLCDDASLYFIDQGMNAVDGADYCANEIRGRTE